MSQINFGVLGLGKIANTFASDFPFVKDAKIKIVGSRDLEKAREFAGKYNIESVGSYEEVFDNPEVNIIYISTPHHLHFDFAKKALEAGKHVLCEKPITVNFSEFSELSKIAKEKNLFLMDAMWTYFLPTTLKAKEWFETGRIGKIKYINIDFSFPGNKDPKARLYNPDLAGGSLLDIGLYPLYYIFLFLGTDYISLHSTGELSETMVDESVSMSLDYGSAKAHLYCSFAHRSVSSAYIYGEKGIVKIPLFWKAKECFLLDNDENVIEHFVDERASHGFSFQIQHVVDCIINNKIESDVVSHTLSGEVLKSMDEIRRNIGVRYPFE